MTSVTAQEGVEVLWLTTLQRAIGRAAHDVKDALNGVSVNLEVVRGRAARADTPASAVAQFAEAAGQQLERLTSLLEAVLALGRADREPVDVALTLRRVATLCTASSSPTDAEVLVDAGNVESALTTVRGDAVRLALTAPLLTLVAGHDRTNRASPVWCRLSGGAGVTVVTISAEGRRAQVPDAVADAVRAAGVRWVDAGSAAGAGDDLSLTFPRA